MGSLLTRRRRLRRTGYAIVVCAAAALGPVLHLGACRRHADIRDEPDGSVTVTPMLDAAEVPTLDSGLETDAFPTCADRPLGECVGTNDFKCAFELWAASTAERCQKETSCKTNGWLEVQMGIEGCVVEIRMDQPNDEIVACMIEQFGYLRCPCGEVKASYYFGTTNHGVCPGPTG